MQWISGRQGIFYIVRKEKKTRNIFNSELNQEINS